MMMDRARIFGSIGRRDRTSARHRGVSGWRGSQGLLFTILLIAPLMYLSGCGSGQTDVGQSTSNSVPVSLNISMPQESAASASTRGSRFWAKLQPWLPTPTSAWAVIYSNLTLTVEVTGPGLPSPITKNFTISKSPPPESGDVIPLTLDVPVGPDRVFAVSGFNGGPVPSFQGESLPVTLAAGEAAVVDIILTVNTTGTVTGTVINLMTSDGIIHATVAVNGTKISVFTGDNGSFNLKDVPPGRQILNISASGFTATTRDVTILAGTLGFVVVSHFPD